MTSFRWGAESDVGRVRQNNQDALLATDELFLVADGMGGHRGGEVAAAIAVEQVSAHFSDPSTDTLVEAVQKANEAVVSRADDEPELRGMGTTLTGMALVQSDGEDRLAIVNVGDSRLYLLKSGTTLEQITEDHSLVATLERQGQLTKEEAEVHPHKNILTRALGIDPMVMVDSWEILPFAGDRYVLCSDGLFNEVEEPDIAEILQAEVDPNEAARRLVDLANQHGGRDNVTVMVVVVIEDGGLAAADEAANRVTKSVHASERVLLTDEVSDAAGAADGGDDLPKVGGFTWRVAAFLGLMLLVLAIGVFAVGTIAGNTFYVGFEGDEVAIFRGRPGGVLWMQPEVETLTGILREDVPAQFVRDLEEGVDEASLEDAQAFVANLRSSDGAGSGGGTGSGLGGAVGDVGGEEPPPQSGDVPAGTGDEGEGDSDLSFHLPG